MLSYLIVTYFSLNAQAQLSCESVFSNEKVIAADIMLVRTEERLLPKGTEIKSVKLLIDRRPIEITSKSDPRFKPTVLDMLNMMTETVFVSGDHKSMTEKGELRLAAEFKQGQSIEFEYIGDKRGSDVIYHLDKISFIKANGKDITVDKNPLSDDATFLQRSEILIVTKEGKKTETEEKPQKISILEKSDIESWSEESPVLKANVAKIKKDQSILDGLREISQSLSEKDAELIDKIIAEQKIVNVPTAISGPVLQEMIKWSELLPTLKRAEVRESVKNGKLSSLLIKARVRANTDFAFKVAKKQIFKYMLVGTAFFGFTHYNNLLLHDRSTTNSTIVSDVLIAKSTFTTENANALQQVAKSFSKSGRDVDPAFKQMLLARIAEKKTSKETAAATEDVQRSISDFVLKEENLRGSSRFYIGDANMNLKAFADKSFNPSLASADYMIGLFEKQNRIVIVSIFKSVTTFKTEMAEVIVDRHSYPVMYENIREALIKSTAQD